MSNRLRKINQLPTDLEIKFKVDNSERSGLQFQDHSDVDEKKWGDEYWAFDTSKMLLRFAQELNITKYKNLKLLRRFRLYLPIALGNENIDFEQKLSQALLTFPQLQQVTIVGYRIDGLDGFKSLGNKLKALSDGSWAYNQKWQ